MKNMSLYEQWLESMGIYHGEIYDKSSELLGMSRHQVQPLKTGAREPSRTQLLAMAAVRAGLGPWSPDNDEELKAISVFVDRIQNSIKQD